MSFPDKAVREKCWASRDDLWKCLDENGDNQELCAKFRATYTSMCPAQWVKHFDRKREYLKFKDRINNDGAHHIERRSGNTLTVAGSGIYANSDSELENSTSTTTMTTNTITTHKDSSSNTSPNARIFRKFQPPTYR